MKILWHHFVSYFSNYIFFIDFSYRKKKPRNESSLHLHERYQVFLGEKSIYLSFKIQNYWSIKKFVMRTAKPHS